MDLHETHHKETQRMPAVLLGVASAAVGFAFHETADRQASLSLLPILGAVLAWAGSFTAGVLYSRAYANGIRANIAMNVADEARNPEWRAQSKAMFDEWNTKSSNRYQAQQWLLLAGALLYLAGHVWHVLGQHPTVASVSSAAPAQERLVPLRHTPPKVDSTILTGEGKGRDALSDHPRPVGTVPALDRQGQRP